MCNFTGGILRVDVATRKALWPIRIWQNSGKLHRTIAFYRSNIRPDKGVDSFAPQYTVRARFPPGRLEHRGPGCVSSGDYYVRRIYRQCRTDPRWVL